MSGETASRFRRRKELELEILKLQKEVMELDIEEAEERMVRGHEKIINIPVSGGMDGRSMVDLVEKSLADEKKSIALCNVRLDNDVNKTLEELTSALRAVAERAGDISDPVIQRQMLDDVQAILDTAIKGLKTETVVT